MTHLKYFEYLKSVKSKLKAKERHEEYLPVLQRQAANHTISLIQFPTYKIRSQVKTNIIFEFSMVEYIRKKAAFIEFIKKMQNSRVWGPLVSSLPEGARKQSWELLIKAEETLIMAEGSLIKAERTLYKAEGFPTCLRDRSQIT